MNHGRRAVGRNRGLSDNYVHAADREPRKGATVMLQTNPLRGFLATLLLFLAGRVHYDKTVVGRQLITPDGRAFRIFRRVEIRKKVSVIPDACFIVRFKPTRMKLQQNRKFSALPMMVFMGFKGFRSKYWCDDSETGMCQGVYEWQTQADAKHYSESLAMRFMTKRSDPRAFSFKILDNKNANYSVEESHIS